MTTKNSGINSLTRSVRFTFLSQQSFISHAHLVSMAAQVNEGPASCKVVLAATVARDLLTEVSQGLLKLKKPPLLVGFLSNKDPAASKYAEWTNRTCQEK